MAYLTPAEFKTYRDITGSGDDTLIGEFIAAAKSAIDSHCHRTFEGSAANRSFDSVRDVEGGVLWVYTAGDLATITSITNGNGDTVAASAYVTEPRNAAAMGKPIIGIRLKSNSSTYWRAASGSVSEDAITVNGVWAYSANVPGDIAQAAKMLTAYYYDHRMSSGGDLAIIPGVSVKIPTGMPSAVRQILSHYVREMY